MEIILRKSFPIQEKKIFNPLPIYDFANFLIKNA